jgi:cytochrome c oxidase subunit II
MFGVRPLRKNKIRNSAAWTGVSKHNRHHSTIVSAEKATTKMGHLALLVSVAFHTACAVDNQRSPQSSGAALFQTCAPCHGEHAEGRSIAQAPALAGMEAWYTKRQLTKFRNGQRGAHPEDTYGLRMRPIARSLNDNSEIDVISDWLAELPPQQQTTQSKGDAAVGKTLWAACAGCHGQNAEGLEAAGAPSLVGLQDWYIESQLSSFLNGYRGGNSDDQNAKTMRAMANIAATPEARANLSAFIHSLQTPN